MASQVLPGHYISNGPNHYAPDGTPVYIYQDESGNLHYVAVRGGQRYFSDSNGTPLQVDERKADSWMGGAFLGGIIGALGGAPVAALGALIGAVLGSAVKR